MLIIDELIIMKCFHVYCYYDAIIIAVPHKAIKKLSINYLKSLGNKKLIIIDVKSIFPKKLVQWQL